jgi:hypothetical protein
VTQQTIIEFLVVGIAPTAEPAELERVLSADPYKPERLAVMTKDAPTPDHEESALRFIHVHVGLPHETTDVDHETIIGDEAILTDAGGVNVPNISADTRYIGFFAHPEVVDHLSGYPIPADEVENYNEAIEDGRTVVLYKADPSECGTVEKQFKDAGLKHVKSFPSRVA